MKMIHEASFLDVVCGYTGRGQKVRIVENKNPEYKEEFRLIYTKYHENKQIDDYIAKFEKANNIKVEPVWSEVYWFKQPNLMVEYFLPLRIKKYNKL